MDDAHELKEHLGIREWLYFEDIYTVKMMRFHWNFYRVDRNSYLTEVLFPDWHLYTADPESEIFEYVQDLYGR